MALRLDAQEIEEPVSRQWWDYAFAGLILAFTIRALIIGEVRGRGTWRKTRANSPVWYWFTIVLYVVFGGAIVANARRNAAYLAEQERREGTETVRQASGADGAPQGLEDLPAEIAQLRDSAFELHRASKFAEAAALYDQAIAGAPNDPELWYWRGMARKNVGQTDGALGDLQRAISLDPVNYDAHLASDRILSAQQRYPEIIMMWTRFIDRNPSKAEAYFERGGAFYRSQNLDAARIDAQRACDLGLSQGCQQAKRMGQR
jgi:tetratricopeptide (TPR) repeat protein